MRINKFLAECGVASRRGCDQLISAGKVTVNGKRASVGDDVSEQDEILVEGKPVSHKAVHSYYMMNKPKGYVCTVKDDKDRKTVMDLLPEGAGRVYPVGRLDYDTEGLLILTDDGDLAFRLTHPKNEIPKTYLVRIEGTIGDKELNRLVQVTARLRAEDGCPWDREQTHGSLKAACVEEAAEVVGGINILEQTGNAENLKEELGDLLLQVVMHAQIAKEEGLFTLEDVMRGITDKMIRRHPHVFGTTAVSGSDEVLVNWAEIKKQEKKGKEWMENYLPGAFDEAEELIGAARKRKGFQ